MKISEELHAFVWQDPTTNNSNTYFINGSKKILIDPGHDHLFGNVKDLLSKLSIPLQDIDLILLTHGHPDHAEGIRAFAQSHALIASMKLNWILLRNWRLIMVPPWESRTSNLRFFCGKENSGWAI